MRRIAFSVGLMSLVASIAAAEGETNLANNPKIIAMHRKAQALREKHGAPAQQLDEQCCRVAQRWANRMARDNYMRHGGGEQIIARGYRTVPACFAGWMASSGHRRWLLSKTELCGWGCQKSKSGQWFYAGVFRRKKTKPEEAKKEEPKETQPATVESKESKATCNGGTCSPRRSVFRFRR